MPLGGASILWAEGTPAESDIADAAPIRSIETSIRNAMASEHNWPSTGGANVGYHLLGSARPFYDVQSNVSSAGTDGRLLVTSDTSRLFHVGSTGTMFLGDARTLSVGSVPPGGQRFYWATEFGGQLATSGSDTIFFPNSGFSGVPFTLVSAQTNDALGVNVTIEVTQATAISFVAVSRNEFSNATATKHTINWLSIGTRTF